MTCDGCAGTVWFDHGRKVWKHAESKYVVCAKPFPRAAGSPMHPGVLAAPKTRKVVRRTAP